MGDLILAILGIGFQGQNLNVVLNDKFCTQGVYRKNDRFPPSLMDLPE